MKKSILIFTLLIAFIGANIAQNFTLSAADVGVTQIVATDTLTDTETRDTTVLIKLDRGGQPYGLSVHVTATNLTGTTDIDVNYQFSNDGSNWVTKASDSLASGNMGYIHEDIDGITGRYFRLQRTGVGTQTSSTVAYLYLFRIPD